MWNHAELMIYYKYLGGKSIIKPLYMYKINHQTNFHEIGHTALVQAPAIFFSLA